MCIHGKLLDDRQEAYQMVKHYSDLCMLFEQAREAGRLQPFILRDVTFLGRNYLNSFTIASEAFSELTTQIKILAERN